MNDEKITQDKWQSAKQQFAKELRKRLKWYQEEALPEEMDPEEIEDILHMLDRLEPMEEDDYFTADKAFIRFQEEYLIKQEKQDTKRRTRKLFGYCGMAAALFLLVFTALNIGTYATTQKGFFAFIMQSDSGKSFFITGEGGEDTDETKSMDFGMSGTNEYADFTDLPPEILSCICIPRYIPAGMEQERLTLYKETYSEMIKAGYSGEEQTLRLEIWIERYADEQAWQQAVNPEAVFMEQKIIGERECRFYQYMEEYFVYFFEADKLYTIVGNCPVSELCKIVENMQYIDND